VSVSIFACGRPDAEAVAGEAVAGEAVAGEASSRQFATAATMRAGEYLGMLNLPGLGGQDLN
jgi:hypothetical protein